ncbi:hypothetical protein G7046_g9279 [Stylonectria norvegica]|nr:hypothetical protein G7046_g9279 [Stylonectria norvegica]
MSGMAAPDRLKTTAALAPATTTPSLTTTPATTTTTTTTINTPLPPRDAHLQPNANPPALFTKSASATPSEPLSEPPPLSTAARNAMILQNFDDNAIRDRGVQTQILFGRKMSKRAKPSPLPLCVITNHPARYRDPRTGLPYFNAYAYREIQRLRRGEYRWSRLLGAWVGSGKYAARGVPERFLNPLWKKPAEEKKPVEVKPAEEGKISGKEEPKKAEEAKTPSDSAKPTASETSKLKDVELPSTTGVLNAAN